MKKKVYLTGVLLFSMAVGNLYADDDPSVVTLFEHSFAEGMGDFKSQESADNYNQVTLNDAWHFNEALQCAECSGEESGWLVSPMITELAEKKYCDIKIIIEHEGQDALQHTLDLKIFRQGMTYWERYQMGGYIYPEPVSSEVYNTGTLTLDAYMQGASSCFAIYFTPSSDESFYRIKNIKITARDWTKVENVVEVNNLSEINNLPLGTPVKLNLNETKVSYNQNDFFYLFDGTGGMQVYCYGYNVPTVWSGGKLTGHIYGLLSDWYGIPSLTKTTVGFTKNDSGDIYNYQPEEITEEEYSSNIMNFVRMPISSEVRFMDRSTISESGRTYTPNYESYFIGLLLPEKEGIKQLYGVNDQAITIELPDAMDTPLSANEYGLWGAVSRHFNANEWYTLCLPFTPELAYDELTCARFVSSFEGELSFETTYGVYNGGPLIVKFNEEKDRMEGVIWSTEAERRSGGDFSFVGTFQTAMPLPGSYYLTAGNTIKPLAEGGKINSFRAYFEPNTPNAARTRSITVDGIVIANGDGSTTDIEDILNGRAGDNREIYNLNGQKVRENNPTKGIYIINGKKVIK
ncbi:MAG: hypothetical protein J1F27_07195 [Prevotellaceae bacterium]|nr:hypothetical protein [Prevotellaceae bacterium]